MAEQVIEGTWEQVSLHGDVLSGKRVRVTILDGEPPPESELGQSSQGTMLRRGMFPQLKGLCDDDFASAEWRGGSDES